MVARREVRLRAVLAGLGALVGLLVAEGGVRALHLVPDRPPAVARVVDPRHRMMLDCYPSNPRGAFQVDLRTAEARARFHHLAPLRWDRLVAQTPWAVETVYNRLRFRDPAPGPVPAGRIRVAVVGDSFTEGQGVQESQTLPAQLQRLLERAEPGRWEVRNCGRRGTDFPRLEAVFKDALEAYQPHVVLYAMVLNDAARDDAFEARQRYVNDLILLNMNSRDEPVPPHPVRLYEFFDRRLETYRISRATVEWYREMYGPGNARGWADTQAALRRLHQAIATQGAQMLVVTWPLLVDLDGDYPFTRVHGTLRDFFLQAGIHHLDLLDALRGRRNRDLWVHDLDHHPNEVALGVAASRIESFVRAVHPASGGSLRPLR
jgi:lysophospholipase L1-like esterase